MFDSVIRNDVNHVLSNELVEPFSNENELVLSELLVFFIPCGLGVDFFCQDATRAVPPW